MRPSSPETQTTNEERDTNVWNGETVPGTLDSKYWRLVVDAIPEVISVHSLNGRILFANARVSEIYEWTPEELVGLDCKEVFHEDDFPCPHESALAEKRSAEAESELEIGGRNFSITVAPIFDERGEMSGYVRVMRDITERQKSQDNLLRAERFATLGQMISGIAHDVGTPLNIISGYSEYLLMRTNPEAPGYKELSTILQQTRRIAEFIKQMLDLARPAQGRTDAIGFKGFLAESLNLARHHFRKSDVEATVTCDINPPLIYGDAPRLRQAFFNLLLNACQQVSPGGRIEVVVDENGEKPGFLMIALIGTESNGRGHDFSISFSGFEDLPRGEENVGMGLSLAKEILDEFRAEVDTKDMGDRGVALMVYLPVSNADGRMLAKE